MTVFDVVIAGAGPAGAMAARDLARTGAHVALIDDSHPREKPCGGGVTRRALELIGGLTIGGGQVIETVTFEAGGNRARVSLHDRDSLEIYARETFDAALLAQAIDAGAVHIRARVTSIVRRDAHWSVNTATRPIEAAWLLGADGPAGVVRKQVLRPFARRQLSIAAGSYVNGVDTDEIVIGFIDRPRGYLWSFTQR